ncbi:hypothetical protein GBAR_LOCUS23123 [Geodia barretti]|uniref:Uncharacterized protein n=1 Tax=Geodia barretti TaxID=519541 RepID=A0AA35T786_GEOBA|nr:hypothetical protein GBAR_LOCUS23123 [Geodia barretti]
MPFYMHCTCTHHNYDKITIYSDLESHFTEAIEEKIARQKQTLKEVSSKNQNLVRHLKFVAKEAHEVAYDDQKMLSSQSSKSELERDVYQLQTQVHALQVSEELFARKMDTVKEKVCTFEFLFNALHLYIAGDDENTT